MVRLACGSASTIRTRLPRLTSAWAKFTTDVVFPTPPFWLARAMTRDMVAAPSTTATVRPVFDVKHRLRQALPTHSYATYEFPSATSARIGRGVTEAPMLAQDRCRRGDPPQAARAAGAGRGRRADPGPQGRRPRSLTQRP